MICLRKFRFLLLMSMPFIAFSQSKGEKDNEISSYSPKFISLLPAEMTHTPLLPISAIEVFDTRFDTSNTGLLQKFAAGKERLIRFKKGTINEIKGYFLSSVSLVPQSTHNPSVTIACFIRKLFVSDNIYIDDGKPVSSDAPSFEIRSGVMAIIEFYLKEQDSFIPLYRFDSTITGTKVIFSHGQNYLSAILAASLRKLCLIHPDKIPPASKSKSGSEINNYYNARFDIPVLKESLKKGIYRTFNDFRRNTPADTPFTVEKTKRGDFLYVKNQKGEDVLQTELWGYSDGNKAYIFSAENYFRLYRHENTFLIYGAKDFASVRKLRLNFGLMDMSMANSNYAKAKTFNSYQLDFDLFQLDMESGELY